MNAIAVTFLLLSAFVMKSPTMSILGLGIFVLVATYALYESLVRAERQAWVADEDELQRLTERLQAHVAWTALRLGIEPPRCRVTSKLRSANLETPIWREDNALVVTVRTFDRLSPAAVEVLVWAKLSADMRHVPPRYDRLLLLFGLACLALLLLGQNFAASMTMCAGLGTSIFLGTRQKRRREQIFRQVLEGAESSGFSDESAAEVRRELGELCREVQEERINAPRPSIR